MKNKRRSKISMPKKISNIKSFITSMSLGKKIYTILWLVTGIFLITLIALFVNNKDKYDYNKKELGVFSKYVEIKPRVPDEVLIQNKLDNEDNYFIQAIQDYDVNGNGIISSDDFDIVQNKFYPLSTVRTVPQLDSFGNDIFDFKKFHASSYGWWTVGIAKQISLKGFTYTPGMTVPLKDIYDDARYVGAAISQQYLNNFNFEALTLRKKSNIESTAPYGSIRGEYAYDLERVKVDGIPGEIAPAKLKPNDDSKVAINTVAWLGGIFLLLLTSSIFSTVISSIYDKKRKALIKGGK